MFAIRISCPVCDYEVSVSDGYNLIEQTWTALFVNRVTRALRIKRIAMASLEKRGMDHDSYEGIEEAICSFARKNEVRLKAPFGEDSGLEAQCPKCRHTGLRRKICGFT